VPNDELADLRTFASRCEGKGKGGSGGVGTDAVGD